MSFTMRARRTRRAVAILAVGLLAAVVPGTALAAGSGATVVRGIQHEFGSCQIEQRRRLPDGRLARPAAGRRHFEVKPMPVQGTMLAHGTEHFEGCLAAVRHLQDDLHVHGALRRRDRAPRPLPPPDHRAATGSSTARAGS